MSILGRLGGGSNVLSLNSTTTALNNGANFPGEWQQVGIGESHDTYPESIGYTADWK